MGVTVKLEGFKELEAELAKLTKAAGKGVLRRSMMKAALPIEVAARAMAPDDPATGGYDLKRSIVTSERLSARQRALHRRMWGSDRASVEVFVGAGPLKQAHLQEFGTIHQSPQAFLRPAWDANKMRVLALLKVYLWGEVSKSVRRAERKAARG